MSWRQDSSASRCFSFLYRHPVESGLATTLDSRGSLRPLACRRFSYPPSNDARPVTLAATTQPCQAPPSLDRDYPQACTPACPAPACCEHGGAGHPRMRSMWKPILGSCTRRDPVSRGYGESVAPITTRRWETKPSTPTCGLQGSSPLDTSRGCSGRSVAGPGWQGGADRCPLLQEHFVWRGRA